MSKITVVKKCEKGRNTVFLDNGIAKTRKELVAKIEIGKHPGYHLIRVKELNILGPILMVKN